MILFSKLEKLLQSQIFEGCNFRLKLKTNEKTTNWSTFFIMPTKGYIKSDIGPIRINDIDFVDIQKTQIKYIGRLIPDKTVDKTTDIVTELKNINIDFVEYEDFFRIIS